MIDLRVTFVHHFILIHRWWRRWWWRRCWLWKKHPRSWR